jgi:dihydroxyacetone kinase-like protein
MAGGTGAGAPDGGSVRDGTDQGSTDQGSTARGSGAVSGSTGVGGGGSGTVDLAALERWVREFARLVHEQRDLLTRLDAAIGDADHGSNLDRGLSAVVAALDEAAAAGSPPADAASLLKAVGMRLVSTVGGASGPLYGTLFLRMAGTAGGSRIAGTAGGVAALDAESFAKALRSGLDGVVARGRAGAGDKTMYDALAPACDALDQALAGGAGLAGALVAATAAAEAGRDATTPMVARKGRASYLGARSAGHQDPGATSVALLVGAARTALG